MSEKLSALVDSELHGFDRAQVLLALARDNDLADAWSRYHLIGQVMRREPVVPHRDLTECVARALNTDLAMGDEAPSRGYGSRRPWLPQRLAMVASVAAVVLIGGLVATMFDDTRSDNPAASLPQQAAASPLAVNNQATRWEGLDPRFEDTLNALLVEHGEFTLAPGMNGLAAYTKFVAYDSR